MFTIISKSKLNRLNEKIEQLENKNKQMDSSFCELVEANRDLLKTHNNLKNDHLQLAFEYEKLEKVKDATTLRNVDCNKRVQSLENLKKYTDSRVIEALGYLRLMRRGAKSPSVQKAIDTLKEI